jgi:hypothetical protein
VWLVTVYSVTSAFGVFLALYLMHHETSVGVVIHVFGIVAGLSTLGILCLFWVDDFPRLWDATKTDEVEE